MDVANELLYAFRILLAALLGGVIGWERLRSDSDAGIRTYMATSMGACAFSLISTHGGGDPTRIAAQVVSGIGFIGAGVIFKEKAGIAGLTTAATLWATAAVGMAAAFGMYVLAVLSSLLLLGTLLLPYVPGWRKLTGRSVKRISETPAAKATRD